MTAELAQIKTFAQLVSYLKDELDWPITSTDFEDLTFEYSAEELGIDAKNAAKIQEIKRLRPLDVKQPWGVFFVKFEPKSLPVVALRRILGSVVVKKRASANASERTAWNAEDLLFISNYGQGEARQISFAHFSENPDKNDLPTLKVLGWDQLDTALHIDDVVETLKQHLTWPDDPSDQNAWRETWGSAFTLGFKEVITTSKALAIRLAQLAREIRDRIQGVIEVENDNGPVTKLMTAFQEALIHDLDVEGFADMYAQTIAYGLLSARVTNPEAATAEGFASQLPVTNPFLKELMETFLNVGGRRKDAGIDFDEFGVNEVVELLDRAKMEAVIRDFGDRNPQEDPVIHFYELFLKEYDAKKRMQRGVFYTPRPVVSFIVRSVHELLKTEYGLEDGLADTATWGEVTKRHQDLELPEGVKANNRFVTVLDPATGTGTFLVEAIDLIHKTLTEKWKAEGNSDKKIFDLWNDYVPKHLLPRLHGYELLMAPYAIAHMKIGLKLNETGYRFKSDARTRIYLTNALEPAQDFSQQLEFTIPALAHESQAVNEVKSAQRFTVVIGNPPYSTISQNMGSWIKALVQDFRLIHGIPIEEKGKRNHLQDDYVKFLRLGLHLVEQSGAGTTAMITNHGYLFSPTFRAMRFCIANSVSGARVLDLNGNTKREDSKRHPGDENVFDIQQGVAISLLWLHPWRSKGDGVWHTQLLGNRESKYLALLAPSATLPFQRIEPAPEHYLFEPSDLALPQEYDDWPKLDEVMPFGGTGIKTNRDAFVIDFNDGPLIERMKTFRDETIPDSAAQEMLNLKENYTWKIPKQRRLFRSDSSLDYLRDVEYRPFDRRRIYYQRHVVYNPRFKTMAQANEGNLFLLSCRQQYETGFHHAWVTRRMFECCVVSAKSREITYGFPVYILEDPGQQDLLSEGGAAQINLSPAFRTLLKKRLGLSVGTRHATRSGESDIAADEVAGYLYAILNSPNYRTRYEQQLKMDFPRVPLTSNLQLFQELSRIGSELIALHLLEDLSLVDSPASYRGSPNPEVKQLAWVDETVWLDGFSKKGGASKAGSNGFAGVTEPVWEFRVGGFRPCEKWLKDRKGRVLSNEDVSHYLKIIGSISETLRLMSSIDDVIEQHDGWPDAFTQTSVD